MRPQSPLWTKIVTALLLFLLYIPIIVTTVSAFNFQGQWSIEAFQLVFSNPSILDALFLSLKIAIVSSLGATVLGTMAALVLERVKFRGRTAFAALTILPLSLPEIVTGISLLIWYVFLNWSLGFWSITAAHITFCFSYVVLVVRARLRGFDRSLEEAAADLGATRFRTFYYITLPLLLPALLSGALLSFTLSFDDFLITLFASGAGFDTLPVKIYSMVRFGISPELNALSTVIFGTTISIVLGVFRPFRRRRPKLQTN